MTRPRLALSLLALASCSQSPVVAVDAAAVDAPEVAAPDDIADAAVEPEDVADVPPPPPPDRTVQSCAEVVIEGAAAQASTRIEGWPMVYGEARGADLVFVAPAVAHPVTLSVASLRVEVRPRPEAGLELPGLASDCGPFAHGVASGDPGSDRVTLWTRLAPRDPAPTVTWVVATDPWLREVVARGEAVARSDRDGAAHVVVTGLAPATTYYYRFATADGARSALGRTRTAAVGSLSHARFAVASCSSLFSGYFNAYRRLAERDDLDLFVHLGDYIYDFVDAQERVRVPASGEVEALTDLASHRRRHALYLRDPDLRAARAAHPWFMLWDNHDMERSAPAWGGGVQAFRDWNPLPPQADGDAPERIYRTLRYGDLVDLYAVDVFVFEGRERLPGDAGASVLGAAQYDWLTASLRESRARWRLLGMQKVFTEFSAFSGWQEYPAARSRLIRFFQEQRVVDNVFLTGDSHFTVYQDVVDDPVNPARPYDPDAGAGAVGAEFLPTSITRGNFDEQLGASASTVLPGVRAGFLRRNPHQVDLELASHGYGVVDVRPERVVAEVWFSPILEVSERETFFGGYAVPRGANRYQRARIAEPTR
ncbi:MAG: alkaline phosphatase D family protein [Polyangiales bacterium]